ncbi:enoyl-CoA hydratase-related protein [Streptomyces sp. NPDC046557]|uniref:enoyl-CoA hydratase/isomerase family protein n=1 Tax=Streptomyces sp. NPDC046557 TaxID=3155372 RepID=UPI00340CDCAC
MATIRLNRPVFSGVDPRLPEEMASAAAAVGQDDAVRAVILYGNRRVFATGADLREMADRPPAAADAHTRLLHAGFNAIAEIPKPVLAAIAGYALGGGLELALCADYRLAGEGAVLGLPEIGLGIIPGTGGTQRLPRLIGAGQAKKLIFTGRRLTAAEALAIGVVDEVVPDADVRSAAQLLAEQFANGPTAALAAAKRAVDGGVGLPISLGLDLEREQFAALFNTEDLRHGFRAALDGRPPAFLGH